VPLSDSESVTQNELMDVHQTCHEDTVHIFPALLPGRLQRRGDSIVHLWFQVPMLFRLHFLLYCIFVFFLHFILCRMCVCYMFNKVLTYLLTYLRNQLINSKTAVILCTLYILFGSMWSPVGTMRTRDLFRQSTDSRVTEFGCERISETEHEAIKQSLLQSAMNRAAASTRVVI